MLITVSILGLWGLVFMTAWNQSQPAIRVFKRTNPRLVKAFRLLVIATLPGCLLSIVLYSQGYKLAAIGMISYVAPTAGILIGFLFPRKSEEITNVLRFYCIVNGFALVGVFAEYLQWNLPALGGLSGMHWIRYSGSDIVNLIGGFYRSPDIMGLHAAQVAMFSLILTVHRPAKLTAPWLIVTGFSCLCLVLSGRRKMLGMPLVFCGVFTILAYYRRLRNFNLLAAPILSLIVVAVGINLVSNDNFVGDEYANYASTLFTDSPRRSHEIVYDSTLSTLQQSGVLGSGMGSATQGTHHLVSGAGSWQEDGVSRVFKELGLWGVGAMLFVAWNVFWGFADSVRSVGKTHPLAVLQLLLISCPIANLCSFMISHQQFSGDPPSAIIVLFVLGMSLAVARLGTLVPQERIKTA